MYWVKKKAMGEKLSTPHDLIAYRATLSSNKLK